jgi:PAS domain S-box-containing protein
VDRPGTTSRESRFTEPDGCLQHPKIAGASTLPKFQERAGPDTAEKPVADLEVPAGPPSALQRYGYAVVATILAWGLRWLLDKLIGYHHPYSIFYIAVLWSAWYGGVGPGLLSTFLGGVALQLLSSISGPYSDILNDFEFYWIVGMAASLLFEAQRRAERRSAWNAAIARDRWRALVRETEQRREAEESASRAEEQLRLVFRYAPVGICRIGLDGRIAEVNPRFCSILGWSEEELLGRSFFDIFYQSKAVEGAGEYLRFQGGALRSYSQETLYKRRDGSTVWIGMAMSVVRWTGELPQFSIAVLGDITERKRAEEELVRTQKIESVALLAGGIAHDFNNLLTAVLGNAMLAMETVPAEGDGRKMLQGVIVAAERAARLTSELLSYAGKGAVAPAALDLSAVVRSACELVLPSVPANIQLEMELAGDIPRLHADATQIRQVVTNLALNAVEAIGDRPGAVHVSTGTTYIEESAVAAVGEVVRGPYLFIRVQDTGDGIDGPVLARIFDPFFTTRFLGRGLGLAALAGIVRSLKGAVLVSTTPGVGSTFTVLFPASAVAPS